MSIIPQLILNSIIAASIYMLVALAFNLSYATAKFFNMAQGATIIVGGYITFWLTLKLRINLYPAIALGILGAGALGFVLEKVVYLPLRKKKATNMAFLIASLGAFFLIQAIIAMIFTSQFQTLSQVIVNQKIFSIWGATITAIQVITLFVSVFTTLALVFLLKKTMLGKQIRAIADDEEVAKIIGINTNRLFGFIFFLSGAIAGLAGILVGLDTGIQPTMALDLLLYGIVSAIVGGVGNLYAELVGALFIAVVENFAVFALPAEWKAVVTYGVLVLFLIFRPQGLLGRKK